MRFVSAGDVTCRCAAARRRETQVEVHGALRNHRCAPLYLPRPLNSDWYGRGGFGGGQEPVPLWNRRPLGEIEELKLAAKHGADTRLNAYLARHDQNAWA
jgi:hypothetical protein